MSSTQEDIIDNTAAVGSSASMDVEENAAAMTSPTTSTSSKSSSVKPSQVVQMTKLRDANQKYKSLLKLAKERIQAQEEELEHLRLETKRLEAQALLENNKPTSPAVTNQKNFETELESNSASVVRVLQVSQVDDGGEEEIWALMEFDASPVDAPLDAPKRYYKKWKQFDSDFALQDFLRRDTGEPIVVPPYSLSPKQSAQIQQEAKQAVSQITEEFRRFRVKSEISKKQADAQIRELHSQSLEKTQRRIEGRDLQHELLQARTDHEHLEKLQLELEQQEARWKDSYNVLLAENKALKSSGSEALLAAQWRQRYETCLKEKQDLESKLELEQQSELEEKRRRMDSSKYEAKYRDLKESFRLYRQKAKEIFEAQQRGDVSPLLLQSNAASEDAKLSYLKNLMVNYLSSDADVREHMERAIGTVLKFSEEDKRKIEQKKAEETDNWFGISVS